MEVVDWSAARLFWDVSQTAIMAVIGIYVWWTSRTRATTQAIKQVDDRVTRVDQHVRKLEQTLEHRPGYSDLDTLRAEIAQTNRSLAEVSAQLQGTTALLHRLHDYLLQERREK
jgi:septal ring factor EnvC (AmiA/AmiB activator)